MSSFFSSSAWVSPDKGRFRDGGWTRDTRLTEYDASGCRIDTQVAESSDHPAVTNSVTLYDFLGRAVVVHTPAFGGGWLTTSNTYDGAAPRMIRSGTTGRPAVTYLHDALGEPAGTVQGGVTAASETRHETGGGEIWRVTVRSTSADGVTNAVATTREQMTGLSDILRGRTVALAADGAVTTVERSFNPATKTETTTAWTDGGTPTVRQTKFGALVGTRGPAEHTVRYYDAFLTPYHVRTFHPVTGALLSRRFLGLDEATWDPVHTETRHGALKVTGQAQFDAFGREAVRTDAMGNAVTNLYDALGRRTAVWGATYPAAYAYDTAGLWDISRQSSLSWAEAKAEEGDTFQSLSDLIKLDFLERTKWLKQNNNLFVAESAVAKKGCIYRIPNVMAVYTSKSGWGDGVIMYVTHLKKRAISDGKKYSSKGYKLIQKKWASSEDDFIDLWVIDGLAAISFAGHGTKYGFKADRDSGYAINPSEVFPKYRLQAVRAYSCFSNADLPGNSMMPDGSIPTYLWKRHVSKDGSYVGFTGWANWLSQFWQEVSVNPDHIPD